MVEAAVMKHNTRLDMTFFKAVRRQYCQFCDDISCLHFSLAVHGGRDVVVRWPSLRGAARRGCRAHRVEPGHRQDPRRICVPSRFGNVRARASLAARRLFPSPEMLITIYRIVLQGQELLTSNMMVRIGLTSVLRLPIALMLLCRRSQWLLSSALSRGGASL